MPVAVDQSIKAIQAILAPATMISACGLLLLGLQGKYGRINDRMRSLAHERTELATCREDQQTLLRVGSIDRQMRELQVRLRKQQSAVLLLFWAVIAFVVDSLMIAGSLLTATIVGDVLVFAVFLVGMTLVLLAALQAAAEIRTSTGAVMHEVEEAMKL